MYFSECVRLPIKTIKLRNITGLVNYCLFAAINFQVDFFLLHLIGNFKTFDKIECIYFPITPNFGHAKKFCNI